MAHRDSSTDEIVDMLDSDFEIESDTEYVPMDEASLYSDIEEAAEATDIGTSATIGSAGPSRAVTSQGTGEISTAEESIDVILEAWTRGPSVPIVYDCENLSGEIDLSIGLTRDSSILDFFLHFLNMEIIGKISKYTNIYCRHLQSTKEFTDNSRIHKWQDTTPNEMYIFYAVCLLMTRNRHLTIEEHWSTDPLLKSSIFGKTMSRDRYEIILQMLHYCDIEQPIYGDRLFKIRALIDHARTIFKKTLKPGKNLCIDESIIVFKGRLLFKQYIPSKRHRFGIKMFILCDVETGSILDFIIYCGDGTEITNSRRFGVSGAVITTLLNDYFGKGHTLWCDNYYSSPELFDYLHQQTTNACGTVRSNRKFMPKFKKLKKGEIESYHKGPLMAIKWHDRREVHMLTTLHSDNLIPTGKINRVTGQPLMKPQAVVDYNKNMGTVDKSDMMLSSLSCMRKSLKWYKKVGLHIIDLFLLNSYYLYKHVTEKKIGIAEFQLNVIRQLINKFSVERSVASSSSLSQSSSRSLKSEILKHMPRKIPLTSDSKRTAIYRRCKMCYESEKKKLTKIMCVTCEVALCEDPCFYNYHKNINY